MLLRKNIKIYQDFSDDKIFKDASVDTSIILIENTFNKNNKIYVDHNFYLEQSLLDDEIWIFLKPEILKLKRKIISNSLILKDIKEVDIKRGILTGYNKAFVIDENQNEEFIKKDKNNSQIIFPILRGKDINKWQIDYKNLYLICPKNGLNIKKDFPLIYRYLKNYSDILEKRSDKGDHWSNLRNCAYYDKFNENKIIWQEISTDPSFTYDSKKYYLLNNAYILTSDTLNLKYLLAILNSNLAKWFFNVNSINLGKKGRRYTKQFVGKLPIIISNEKVQKEISNDVDTLLSKYNTINHDQIEKKEIMEIEERINSKIYEIYNLNNEEINIIER